MGIGFVLVFGVTSLGLAWRTRRRGHLLLDTGPLGTRFLSRNPVTYLPAAAAFAVVWIWGGKYSLILLAVASAGVLAITYVLEKRTRLRFTDQGICFVGLLEWSRIRSYRWHEIPGGGEELEVDFSMKRRGSSFRCPIPAIYRARVAEILASHVQHGRSDGTKASE
jgi:hypothetical protein